MDLVSQQPPWPTNIATRDSMPQHSFALLRTQSPDFWLFSPASHYTLSSCPCAPQPLWSIVCVFTHCQAVDLLFNNSSIQLPAFNPISCLHDSYQCYQTLNNNALDTFFKLLFLSLFTGSPLEKRSFKKGLKIKLTIIMSQTLWEILFHNDSSELQTWSPRPLPPISLLYFQGHNQFTSNSPVANLLACI